MTGYTTYGLGPSASGASRLPSGVPGQVLEASFPRPDLPGLLAQQALAEHLHLVQQKVQDEKDRKDMMSRRNNNTLQVEETKYRDETMRQQQKIINTTKKNDKTTKQNDRTR